MTVTEEWLTTNAAEMRRMADNGFTISTAGEFCELLREGARELHSRHQLTDHQLQQLLGNW